MTHALKTSVSFPTRNGSDQQQIQGQKQGFDQFTCFPELPVEIRRMIWREVASEPRMVDVRMKAIVIPLPDSKAHIAQFCSALSKTSINQSSELWKTNTNQSSRVSTANSNQASVPSGVPVILQINNEAREVGLKVYSRIYEKSKFCKYVLYFNFEQDTLISNAITLACMREIRSWDDDRFVGLSSSASHTYQVPVIEFEAPVARMTSTQRMGSLMEQRLQRLVIDDELSVLNAKTCLFGFQSLKTLTVKPWLKPMPRGRVFDFWKHVYSVRWHKIMTEIVKRWGEEAVTLGYDFDRPTIKVDWEINTETITVFDFDKIKKTKK